MKDPKTPLNIQILFCHIASGMSSIVKGEESRTIKTTLLHLVKTNSVMRKMNCEIVSIKLQKEHRVANKISKKLNL